MIVVVDYRSYGSKCSWWELLVEVGLKCALVGVGFNV